MINRIAVIVRFKAPFIEWINNSDPYGTTSPITIDEANEDSHVYLVDDKYADNFEGWLRKNYKTLFENELYGWCTDPARWPEKLDLRTFRKWCTVECFTVVLDLGRGGIFDDETFNEISH
jgi:hypothetical protein